MPIRTRSIIAREYGFEGLASNPLLSSLSVRIERLYIMYYNGGLPQWAHKYHVLGAEDYFFEGSWGRRLKSNSLVRKIKKAIKQYNNKIFEKKEERRRKGEAGMKLIIARDSYGKCLKLKLYIDGERRDFLISQWPGCKNGVLSSRVPPFERVRFSFGGILPSSTSQRIGDIFPIVQVGQWEEISLANINGNKPNQGAMNTPWKKKIPKDVWNKME